MIFDFEREYNKIIWVLERLGLGERGGGGGGGGGGGRECDYEGAKEEGEGGIKYVNIYLVVGGKWYSKERKMRGRENCYLNEYMVVVVVVVMMGVMVMVGGGVGRWVV